MQCQGEEYTLLCARFAYLMKAFFLFARIALRNVRRNTRRSLLTIFAIAFGLVCLIVFEALKVGLHQEMISSTTGLDAASLQIHARGHELEPAVMNPVPRPEKVVSALRKAGAEDFSHRLKTPALLLAGKKSSAVLLSGVYPAEEARVTFISRKVLRGSYLGGYKRILLGEELARNLGVDVGDTATVTAQNRHGVPVTEKFAVGGIYRTELAAFDSRHVYLSLQTAQEFLDAGEMVTEIAVRTKADSEKDLAASLRAALPEEGYQVKTWEETIPDLKQLIGLNDATMNLLILIVFAIIAMGIANTMTMVVFERFRELGILAAIGTTPAGILVMVVMESFFLGAIAALLGSVSGAGVCAYLARYGIDLTQFTSANQYFANGHVLKAHLLAVDLVIANIVTVTTALVAGVYPAWKASRLKPVDAINHL